MIHDEGEAILLILAPQIRSGAVGSNADKDTVQNSIGLSQTISNRSGPYRPISGHKRPQDFT